jgi:hypothetical protein
LPDGARRRVSARTLSRHGRLRRGPLFPGAISYREGLRVAVAGGAQTYGFTLVVWTTGALAISEQGLPRPLDALAFLGGALLATALIAIVTFAGLRSTWRDERPVSRAYGAIHAPSVAAGVLMGWLLAAALDGAFAFAAASFVAVVPYNLLLAVEVALSRAGKEGGTPHG